MHSERPTPTLDERRNPFTAGHQRASAVFLWWASGVLCSFLLGAQLLPSLSVLSALPFRGTGDDLKALFLYFTTHPTTGNLVQSLLLTWLLARLMLSLPLTWVIANVGSVTMAWPRLLLRVLRRLPAVLGLFVIGHVALMLLLGLSAPYLLSRVVAATTSFEFAVLAIMLLGIAALALGGLALYDVSRVAAIYGGNGRRVLSTAFLDGLTLLIRRPWRVLVYTAGTWLGALVVSLVAAVAASSCAGHAPESWGQVNAWLLMQLGVASGLLVRAFGWRTLVRLVTAERTGVPDRASQGNDRGRSDEAI